MSASDQTAIVLYTMQSLKGEGSWCGETHVQKTLYLCQEVMGVPSNFKFILYKHGPYSFELSEHLQGLIADDLVCVLTRPPYGPTVGVSDEARSIAARVDRNGSVAEHIAFMSKKLSRKGVADLEKLATAVYVNRKYGLEVPIEKRAEVLTSLKPHVSVEAARDAFAEAEAIEDEARSMVVG
jgi:uncharacterized protein YwgA